MADLLIARLSSDAPMGAQVYQGAVIARAPEALRHSGWSVDQMSARSLRSSLGGTHRIPLTWLTGASSRSRAAYARLLYRGHSVVHRMNLELPPGQVDVVTLHDVVAWRFPDEARPVGAAAEELRRAAAVVCVSQFSAQEATDLLGVGRVHVVPNGVDDRFLDAPPAAAQALAKNGIRSPFILVGAGATQRKNLPALAAAWRVLHAKWPHVQLVLTGPAHPRRDQLFAGLPSVVQTGWLPASAMPGLVAAAQVVAIPSTYEGFGLPALEAMAARTPLVATDIPALREVVADPSRLVDPTADGLIDGINDVLTGGAAVDDDVRAGRARAEPMTWDASVAGHLQVWQKAAGGTA